MSALSMRQAIVSQSVNFWHSFEKYPGTHAIVPKMQTRIITLFFVLLMAAAGPLTAQLATANATVTPSLMMGFTGQVQGNNAQLNWTMESQTNCKWFVIERSGDTGGYDSISVVAGLNNGNPNDYLFIDNNMLKGNNYYRLREVDMDGVIRYSKVITLNNVEVAGKMAIYPNPVIAVLNYSISSPAAQQVIVQVYNLSGIVLQTSQQQLSAGNNQQTLAINGLKSGNYILKVSSRTGASQYVQPFVKIM